MAGKTIAEAQQARDAKRGKKPKDKTTKGPAGSIIQSGNQAYIVDADGKAHEIVASSAATTTTDSAHFLQTDDINSIDQESLSSILCAPPTLLNTRI
jgi:hypothetical protein